MLGPAKLFFGCRRSDQDFLYADELKDYEARGLVALHVAFSRANGAKTYVQHLLEEQRDSVWRMIEDGAIVYVCGDGGRMEPGVKATLMGVYREKSGASEEDAQRWIDNMGTQNRYVLDVWTGG
jgi:cytochrome P450/NADPH-cytochrome P450 reductase